MKLSRYLKEHSMTATDCANGVGCAVSSITRLLNGERIVDLNTAVGIERWSGGLVAPRDLLKERANELA
jgi:plasmid maintenance system antidote protein VapI